MATKTTKDILESFLNCKFKAHLKLTGQEGIKSDYEKMLLEMRDEVRCKAIAKVLAKHPEEDVLRDVSLSTSVLEKRASSILDATLEDDPFCLRFDGLKKVEGFQSWGTSTTFP